MITQQRLAEVLSTYKTAWEHQDPDLILKIFTPDARYYERAFKPPHKSHKEIRQYWLDKVLGEQRSITVRLLNTYVCDSVGIAEWDAEFDDIKQNRHVRMREIAVLEFDGDLIKSLREYWQSESAPRNS